MSDRPLGVLALILRLAVYLGALGCTVYVASHTGLDITVTSTSWSFVIPEWVAGTVIGAPVGLVLVIAGLFLQRLLLGFLDSYDREQIFWLLKQFWCSMPTAVAGVVGFVIAWFLAPWPWAIGAALFTSALVFSGYFFWALVVTAGFRPR